MSLSPMVAAEIERVRVMPEAYVRGKISDPRFLDSWFCALESRVVAGKRDAIRLVAEMLKLVGPSVQAVVLIAQRFGVENEQELERMVKRGKSLAELDDASVEVHWQEAMTLIELCLKEQPSLLQATVARLQGLSTATLVEPHQTLEDAPGSTNGTHLDPEDA